MLQLGQRPVYWSRARDGRLIDARYTFAGYQTLKGDSYVDALMKQNGFSDKAALQRFIVANANPDFMAKLGLSEQTPRNMLGMSIPV